LIIGLPRGAEGGFKSPRDLLVVASKFELRRTVFSLAIDPNQ